MSPISKSDIPADKALMERHRVSMHLRHLADLLIAGKLIFVEATYQLIDIDGNPEKGFLNWGWPKEP